MRARVRKKLERVLYGKEWVGLKRRMSTSLLPALIGSLTPEAAQKAAFARVHGLPKGLRRGWRRRCSELLRSTAHGGVRGSPLSDRDLLLPGGGSGTCRFLFPRDGLHSGTWVAIKEVRSVWDMEFHSPVSVEQRLGSTTWGGPIPVESLHDGREPGPVWSTLVRSGSEMVLEFRNHGLFPVRIAAAISIDAGMDCESMALSAAHLRTFPTTTSLSPLKIAGGKNRFAEPQPFTLSWEGPPPHVFIPNLKGKLP